MGLRRLHLVPLVVAALGVIVVMLVAADHARVEADRARQAQVQMEHIRTVSHELDALTWRSLATLDHLPDSVVAGGVGHYREMAAALRALKRLGVDPARVRSLKVQLGQVYGSGLQALTLARSDLDAGRRLARQRFSPTVDALSDQIEVVAHDQEATAQSAQRRARRAMAGSVGGGLLLLALLAWRVHLVRRRTALHVQRRAVERRSEQRLRALSRHSSDVVAVVGPDGEVRWLAESVERMLGYTAEDLAGTSLLALVHPDEAHRARAALRTIAEEPGAEGVLSLRVAATSGADRHVEVVAENHLDDPDIGGILLNLRDVSERVALEHQLRHQAFHDSLTGLPNRALFEDRLTHALVRARRHGERSAVIFVDLDDFKTINDSLGHQTGDDLLRLTGARLQTALRAEDTAARLGGDEFAVLLESLEGDEDAAEIAERVLAALEQPVTLGERRITPSASIGIAYPDAAMSAADVLGNADVAMYAAKERGKGRVAAFEPSMRERVVERMDLSGDLATAVERDELVLEYQPVVALDAGAITGVEALLRWNHPTRGRLAPDRFIGLAETTGLIVPVGRWVLRAACAQLAAWDAAHPDLEPLALSVNVSTRQLAEPSFPDDVRAILAETGVAPSRVTLEITERLLVDDSPAMQEQLRAVKAAGVRLAVDDFGTGYSALSYLQVFPIDVLKVDRSFVSGIDQDPEKARLVQGIVDMGRNLHLDVVAEGIEEVGEATLLRDFRSGYGQGYLFSRPVAADAIPPLAARDVPLLTPEPS